MKKLRPSHSSLTKKQMKILMASHFNTADLVALSNEQLIPKKVMKGESKVFYLKMKGDYHRYLVEFQNGSNRKEAAENTLFAYKATQTVFENSLMEHRVALPPYVIRKITYIAPAVAGYSVKTWISKELQRKLPCFTFFNFAATLLLADNSTRFSEGKVESQFFGEPK
ncbi:hypothetical protein CsatA_009560 [Cannabis sativa]